MVQVPLSTTTPHVITLLRSAVMTVVRVSVWETFVKSFVNAAWIVSYIYFLADLC